MLSKLTCPSCTAPLEYDGVAATIRCPYCDTNVVVPESLRPAPTHDATALEDVLENAAIVQQVATMARSGRQLDAIKLMRSTYGLSLAEAKEAVALISAGHPVQLPGAVVSMPRRVVRADLPYAPEVRKRSGGCLWFAVFMVLLVMIPLGSLFYTRAQSDDTITTVVNEVSTALPSIDFVPAGLQGIKLPPEANRVMQTLNSSFASEIMRFGSEGIGPGKFEDARAIAVDAAGHIFVADYTSGRVQVFNTEVKFINQWSFGDRKYVDKFAADREGHLYVAYDGNVNIHDGTTGEVVGTLPLLEPDSGGRYDDSVAVGADGSIYAVWNGDIVRFDRSLQPNLRIVNAIENATGGSETTTILAVNGVGDIYALGESMDVVVRFASDGRFVNQFGGEDNDDATLSAASSIATDSQGRVYVGDIAGVKVYTPGGQYIDAIGFPGYAFGVAVDETDHLFVAARTEVIEYALPE